MVSRDPEAAAIARRHGCRVLPEAANRGQSAAVAAGAAALGTAGIIAIPGDVPLVEPSEIEAVLAAHGQAPAVTIVPSRDGRGTNGLACSPPDAIPFHFGDDSFRRHLAEARHRGIEPRVLRLPGLALDIDTAEDVRALLDRPAHTRAQRFLDDRGVAARLGAGVESRPDREAEPLVTGEVA